MRSETEIRQMLAILRGFNTSRKHDLEITALSWVLGEYPLTEENEADAASNSDQQLTATTKETA